MNFKRDGGILGLISLPKRMNTAINHNFPPLHESANRRNMHPKRPSPLAASETASAVI